ncbi:hypothetical protein [Methylobacterium sp. Leaf117]|nr:hypothetical protein [Methylobacterium sp. Leaf117]
MPARSGISVTLQPHLALQQDIRASICASDHAPASGHARRIKD